MMIDAPSGEYWTLVRFQERVTDTMYLVECLDQQTGEPYGFGCYLIDLRLVMLQPNEENARARIFDDFTTLRKFADLSKGSEERVVSLVKS